VIAYSSLGVAITLNVNVPQTVVTTTYPGADPATVEANVTRPIEDAIATLPNIDTNGLTSTSAFGVSIVRVQFTSAANADLVAVDVQRVVNGVRSKLPADAESRSSPTAACRSPWRARCSAPRPPPRTSCRRPGCAGQTAATLPGCRCATRAYLVWMVTRQALNRLRTLARQREDYAEAWLPEPLLTSPDIAEDVELAEPWTSPA
jgi:hypothetical protein